jgi:hypothetical protein
VTFDAAPATSAPPALDLAACERVTVCDLTGVERFLVWGMRWCASQHDDPSLAELCLRDSFERAGLTDSLPGFRRFVAAVQGAPARCASSARLGCWRVNRQEASMLHALACLQADRFGDAWRMLAGLCPRWEAARAMLALGEIADALSAMEARIRPGDEPASPRGPQGGAGSPPSVTSQGTERSDSDPAPRLARPDHSFAARNGTGRLPRR